MSSAFDGILDRYSLASSEFRGRLATVRADQWAWPTPCTDWDVRLLVNHMTRGNLNFVGLLSGPDRPTAIFAANDLTCVGALSAAAALGVRVPEELSLVGFDNSVFARLRALWLTSVDATAFELGQRAARRLLARIERPDAPGETVLLPPRLEVRGSSGPAPA